MRVARAFVRSISIRRSLAGCERATTLVVEGTSPEERAPSAPTMHRRPAAVGILRKLKRAQPMAANLGPQREPQRELREHQPRVEQIALPAHARNPQRLQRSPTSTPGASQNLQRHSCGSVRSNSPTAGGTAGTYERQAGVTGAVRRCRRPSKKENHDSRSAAARYAKVAMCPTPKADPRPVWRTLRQCPMTCQWAVTFKGSNIAP